MQTYGICTHMGKCGGRCARSMPGMSLPKEARGGRWRARSSTPGIITRIICWGYTRVGMACKPMSMTMTPSREISGSDPVSGMLLLAGIPVWLGASYRTAWDVISHTPICACDEGRSTSWLGAVRKSALHIWKGCCGRLCAAS